ncbi:MAG: hypothetical protein WC919_05250 [Candidatus Paceibacterota bacterium]|jgi:hypothetical protein
MNCDVRDVNDAAKFTKLRVRNDAQIGLGVWIDGYSTHTAADDDPDAVFYLEVQDGKPVLRVWADINSEEPTHTIDLSGAHINCRLSTFKGNLYYYGDDQEVKHHLASFEEQAVNATLLERKVLDKYWDDRLDAASCSPHFEYEVVVDG